jgi:deoxyribodipyrimidine photo-lyase
MAPRQADFIRRHLRCLQQVLAERGIPLYYRQVPCFLAIPDTLAALCSTERITHLFFNRQYPLNEQRRDQAVLQRLQPSVICHTFDDNLLLAPGEITTNQGAMFRVFTPFKRAALARLREKPLRPLPIPVPRSARIPVLESPLTPFDYPTQDSSYFPAGEASALQRLQHFCEQLVADYTHSRDFPALDATSQLSPYLTLGILSPRQCLEALQSVNPEILDQPRGSEGAVSWFNELLWREFYRHLIIAFPNLCRHQPFLTWTDQVGWQENAQWLQAWQQGCTGYPLVDAAMRQLNQIGWMHNRLRMVVASFFSKHLLLNWRLGERYFMSQLIDGDFAANNGGWQWAASTGCDAVPYFRIFNPTSQSQRFDPQGTFIRSWIPELAHLSARAIHAPDAILKEEKAALEYPSPLVDHRVARQRALTAFAAAKSSSKK